MRVCLEISPLQEGSFTGIPEVTARVAEQMLADSTITAEFFYESAKIPSQIVRGLLDKRSGVNLRYIVENRFFGPIAPACEGEKTVALYTNRKAFRNYFEFETLIIHDLSPLTHPQYHSIDTCEYYHKNFLSEIESSDWLFCVSDSTKNELVQYFGNIVEGKASAVPLGVDQKAALEMIDGSVKLQSKPFVMILGTLEPRKNIGIILEFLSRNNNFLVQYDVIFTGRIGWLLEFDQELDRLGLSRYRESGEIKTTGFIDEKSKFALLNQAALVIYPSIFEGFGLPVIEAMAVGTNVLTTASSSIPEVGGDYATYFNPFSVDDFASKVYSAFDRFDANELISYASRYTWLSFYQEVLKTFMRL